MRSEHRKIVGVVIHIVSVAGLAGASVTAPVMCDDAIAVIQEEHHLRVPVVARKRPTVRENDRLAAAPILVIELRAVFRRDGTHGSGSFSIRKRCLASPCFRAGYCFLLTCLPRNSRISRAMTSPSVSKAK